MQSSSLVETVFAPGLISFSISANPTPDDVSVVGIKVVVESVEVNVLPFMSVATGSVGINGLDTKIELLGARDARHIDARTDARPAWGC